MKKRNFLLSLLFIAFMSSALPYGSHDVEVGKEAPVINMAEEGIKLDSLKGKSIMLNFWSASDPLSRIANHRMSELAKADTGADTAYVSVCLDSDRQLAREIAKNDNISDRVIALNASEVSPQTLSDYQVATGCRTFVIDRYGVLKAIGI